MACTCFSMKGKIHFHKENVKFRRIGLIDFTGMWVQRQWLMSTFGDLVNKLGHAKVRLIQRKYYFKKYMFNSKSQK